MSFSQLLQVHPSIFSVIVSAGDSPAGDVVCAVTGAEKAAQHKELITRTLLRKFFPIISTLPFVGAAPLKTDTSKA